MAAKTFSICGLVLAVCFQAILAADFDYDYNSGKGPNKWAEKFPDYCGKSSQSPVNIQPSKATYDKGLGTITMTGYDTKKKFDVSNNGHSFVVVVTPGTYSISGGGLPGTFELHSFHLHWGSTEDKGSEHTVDGKMYPAELHLVHFNKKYNDLGTAVAKSDGLAVLGIFYKAGAENAALQSFLKYSVNVTAPKASLKGLTQTYSMNDLLPENTNQFYRYKGSLTTPTCNEAVTWTVFKSVNTISEAQLELFRSLKMDNTTMMVDNYRPPQPLNGRVIKSSFMVESGANHVTNQMEIVMALIMASLLKMFL